MRIEILKRDVKVLTYSLVYLCIHPSRTFILFYGKNEHLIISPDDFVGFEEYVSTQKLNMLLKDAGIHEVVLCWPNLTAEINRALIESRNSE